VSGLRAEVTEGPSTPRFCSIPWLAVEQVEILLMLLPTPDTSDFQT